MWSTRCLDKAAGIRWLNINMSGNFAHCSHNSRTSYVLNHRVRFICYIYAKIDSLTIKCIRSTTQIDNPVNTFIFNYSGRHLRGFLIWTHEKKHLSSQIWASSTSIVFAFLLIFQPPKMPTKDVITYWTLKRMDMVHVIHSEMYHALRGTRPEYYEKRSDFKSFLGIKP